ncbi:unnamed protein product, partial [Prorocentrum cordatum]
EVGAELRQLHIVGCPGAKIPKHPQSPRHAQNYMNHIAIHFGCGKHSIHVNNSAGCAILLNSPRFKTRHIKDISAPPPELQGRGGTVVIDQGATQLTIVTACSLPMPWDRKKVPQWRTTMTKVATWVRFEILAAPSRYTPILMMDLNDRSTKGPDGNGTVGEIPTGKIYHHMCVTTHVEVANTYCDTGPTHDHKPLIIKLEVPPVCYNIGNNYQHLDRGAIAMGLKEGFLESLETQLTAHHAQLEEYLADPDGTHRWGLTTQFFRLATLEHFSANARRPDWYREARDHKLQLLRQRALLRQRLHAAKDAHVHETQLQELGDTIADISKRLRRHMKDTNHKYQEMQSDDLWQVQPSPRRDTYDCDAYQVQGLSCDGT